MKVNILKKLGLILLILPTFTILSSCKNEKIISFTFDSDFSFDSNTKIYGKTVKIFPKTIKNAISWQKWYTDQEITSESFLFDICYTINQKCKENKVVSNWEAKVMFDLDNFNKRHLYTFEYSISFAVPQTFGIFSNIDFYKEKINNYNLKFIENNFSQNILFFDWSEVLDENSWHYVQSHRYDTNRWFYHQDANNFIVNSFVLMDQDPSSYEKLFFHTNKDIHLNIFRYSFDEKNITEEQFIKFFNNSNIYFKKDLILNFDEYIIGEYPCFISEYVKQIKILKTTDTSWTEVVEIYFYDFIEVNATNNLVVENCKIINGMGS